MNIEKTSSELEKCISKESKIYKNELMSKHTSFKVGGKADIFVNTKNEQDIKSILEYANKNETPITVIGNGSNLLVKDGGIRGIVLRIDIQDFNIEKISDEYIITVGAGVKNGFVAQKLLIEEIEGFEFAAGIPGSIGGAIRMNAGAHGSEMKDIVKTITYMDRNGKINKIENEQAEFEYRKSLFSHKDYIIIETEIQLEKGNTDEIKEKMAEYANFRKEKQPIEYPSAGSTFKRGTDFITAKLIDECGLKGYQIGGAQISEKHAGFIINKDNATAKDVIKLMEYTKEQVYEKFGKNIEAEIEIL